MKKLILNDKQRINEWAWQKVGRESPFFPHSKYEALGIEEDGEIIAGVVFDGWKKDARCSMHCAGVGKRWLTKEFLYICFNYVFNLANCKVIINSVSSDNADSIRFTEHIGFKEVGRIKNGDGDCDLIIYALNKEDCRHLNIKQNRHELKKAA